ncbi:triacylglycerol lipase [Dyadobacter soli]|uniref:Triacylglycerol lipase n=1 Tax=Dyadobacter soli TaxID=659014 RepID=A0A1G7AAA6_9BACT|nr:alpha/beta fold hydrolase [Dyadobacter soli]SDE10965.1 triacylglycerol lipase [Dyadobacter soli]
MANTLILVHGFLDTGRRMAWMSKQLSALGWKVFTPSLLPSNGTEPLEKLAERLSSFIRENTQESDRIDIIAFSMGGLIARYYLQRLGGLSKTDRLITIATPHNGTLAAYVLPFAGVRQMRPNSDFLNSLNANAGQLQQLVFVSYYSPFDLIIIPARSSMMPAGKTFKVFALMHPWMIFDKKLLKKITHVLEGPVDFELSEAFHASPHLLSSKNSDCCPSSPD